MALSSHRALKEKHSGRILCAEKFIHFMCCSRNKLIRFEIMLTTGTFSLALFSAVAGMLGENLVLPESITQVR